jgi:hypothetical protein
MWVFPEFSSGKNSSCYPISDDILVTEKMPATSLFHFCSSHSYSLETHCFFVMMVSWLMLFKDMIAVYSEDYTKHRYSLWANCRDF